MTDYINRQAAIDAVMELMPSLTTADGTGQFDAEIYRAQEVFVDIGQVLNDLPSVEVEPVKRGKWILKSEAPITGEKYWECSLCGCGSDSFDTVYFTPYCPYCGAKMKPIPASPENGQEGRC